MNGHKIPEHLAAAGVSDEDVIILRRDLGIFLGNPTDPTLSAWIKDPDHPMPEPFFVGNQRAWTLATIRRVQRELQDPERVARGRQTAEKTAGRARTAKCA